MSVAGRVGLVALTLGACASPPPHAEREVALTYAPPTQVAAAASNAAPWMVALAGQPGDVAPSLTVARPRPDAGAT